MSSFDKVIKLACKPKPAPPKAKYLNPIIAATWSKDGAVRDICKALVPPLREPNAVVAFKALIVLHAIIRNGATDNVLAHLSSSEVLRLHDVSAGNWEGRSHFVFLPCTPPRQGYNAPQNIQNYALYLDSRILAYKELKHDAIQVQVETNRDMRLNNSIERDMAYTTALPSKTSSNSELPQRSKTIMGRKLRVMTVEEGLFREIRSVQQMIDSLVECRFYMGDLEDELTITTLRMLVKDLLILFQVGNEGMINILEHYFKMSKYDAEEALSIYRDFCSQTERVVEYLGVAKKLQSLLDVPIPNFKNAPVSLANLLQEYLNNPKSGVQNEVPLSLQKELVRADEDILRQPSSHEGYQRKYVILHQMTRYREAFEAFETMLSKMDESSDPEILKLRQRYVDATPAIRDVVQKTIAQIPRELVDTDSGELYDKETQALAFEQHPVFHELRSSMTTRVDDARIQQEVGRYYQYVMFSHKWEAEEPTFQMVKKKPVYKLPSTPKFAKLQNFCKLVSRLGFKFAWCDTCCVNQADKNVQQESVLSMFRWYRGSAVTVVHLLGVFSDSEESPRCLWKSIWNTRGWTYQEYVASEVVQFYTEDWKPYLGLHLFNHKTSPGILLEMEHAMSLTIKKLSTLRPGLDRAREKLYMAANRRTKREEDIAYCLFGIFNAALPVIYGEGNQAVGRLLDHVVTGSRDITILAWTGRSGSYNSCLPVDLTVYDALVPPHVPRPIRPDEIDRIVRTLHSSLPDVSQAVELHRCLITLPPPSFAASRLQLSGITFPTTNLIALSSDSDKYVYRVTTSMLGDVRITTTDDLAKMEDLILIHPWIELLLSRDVPRREVKIDPVTRALRLVARLRQPFGALLLASFWGNQYKRVAADCLIMVQLRAEVGLAELTENVTTVDVQ